MSIELLDSKLNIAVDQAGIVSYSHPECSTVITSDYKVFNATNGRELKVFQSEKLIGGQISSRFKGKRANFSFGRLLALMAGHSEKGYYRIIDESKPLSLENITTLKDYMKSSVKDDQITLPLSAAKKEPLAKSIQASFAKDDDSLDIKISKNRIREYFLDYVPCEDNLQYITEDGLIFSDRAKALLHQLSVDKGKELANMVMSESAGWVLAERMYLTQVNYAQGKPLDYNFRTIMENNNGIIETGDRTYLVEAGEKETQQFSNKEEMSRWLKAKALVDMVVDMRYNVSKIAGLID